MITTVLLISIKRLTSSYYHMKKELFTAGQVIGRGGNKGQNNAIGSECLKEAILVSKYLRFIT